MSLDISLRIDKPISMLGVNAGCKYTINNLKVHHYDGPFFVNDSLTLDI
jgi:hypothetical protein